MQFRFVGCGDAFGSGGRYNTCFHVAGERANFLIDCGASSLPALKRQGVDREAIDLVLITHFHGDHFGGLPFLLLDAQFTRRTRPLVIAGPEGIEARLKQAMEAMFENSSTTKQRFDLDVVALRPDATYGLGAVNVTPFSVLHGESGGPFLAYRVECEGRIIAYTAQRMDRGADPPGAGRRSLRRRGLYLRQSRQESSQPENARSATCRDQAEAAGPDPYE